MNAWHRTLSLALALLIATAGCGRKQVDEDFSLEKFHHGPALTDEDAKRHGEAVEAAARGGDPEVFISHFDWEALFQRSLTGVKVPASARQGLLQGMRQGQGRQNFAKEITDGVGNGGTYRFVGVRHKEGEVRVLLRMVGPEGHLNYHELMPVRCSDGVIRSADIYVLGAGESVSELLRRYFLVFQAQVNRSLLDRLAGRDQDLVKHQPTWSKMAAAVRAGEHAEALRLYDQLPPGVQKEKFVQLIRIQSISSLNDNESYQKAFAEYEALFPGDAGLDLLRIDAFIAQKKYPEALASVDRIDQSVGGDPYLDTFRANLLTEQGEYAKAREAANRALAAVPDLQAPYLAMITITVREQDHISTAKWINTWLDKFNLDLPDDLDQLEEYAHFVKSPEYRKLVEARKKKD